MLGPLLDQPGVTAVKLVTLLGTTLVGVGLARSHYDRGVRGGSLERLRLRDRLRQLRLFGLPDWKEESARWARLGRPPGPLPRVRAALRAARDADEALKSTTISDERGILDRPGAPVERPPGGGRMRLARSRRGAPRPSLALHSGRVVRRGPDRSRGWSMPSAPPRRAGATPPAPPCDRLLAATPPTDTLYPQILYTQAMVAGTAGDMRRRSSG